MQILPNKLDVLVEAFARFNNERLLRGKGEKVKCIFF